MPVHPFGWRVEGFAAVFGQAFADAAHNGRVDADTGDDGLTFGERGEFGEHCASCAFDGLGDGLLVNRVDDSHNDLRHTLRENVLV